MPERWWVALDRRLGLAAVGAGLAWWRIRFLGDVRYRLSEFYVWFAVAFAAYLAALWLVRHASADRQQPSPPRAVTLVLILGAAALFRLTLWNMAPALSDDLYRYLWDGRVQLAGFDPYRYPPDADELAALRDASFTHIVFPQWRTIYPPLAQWMFRLWAAAGGWLGLKALWLLMEGVLVAALLVIARARGESSLWLVAYAWHPLPILEIAGSGHNDVLGVALLWVGVAAWTLRRPAGAAVAWGLAFLAKYVSVILLPWWWLQQAHRRWIGLCLAVAALPLLVWPSAVTALAESLTAVSGRIESNASGYLLLWRCVDDAAVARWLAAGLGVAGLWWLGRRERDPVRYLMNALVVAVVLTPVLHPWYLVWLVPGLVFWRPARLVAFSGTVVLAYAVWPIWLAGGSWSVPAWARALEYGLPMVLVVWDVARRRRRCASG